MTLKKDLSGVKIQVFFIFLICFLLVLFFMNKRIRYQDALDSLEKGGTVYERMVFVTGGPGKSLEIHPFRDIRVDPAELKVFLPSGSEDKDIHVFFELRDTLSLIDPSGREYILKDGDKLPKIETGKKYSLTLSGGYNPDFDHTDITFYRSSGMASAFIDTKSGSMEYLDSDKENAEEGTIRLFDEDGNTEYSGKLAEIKGHGNSTWSRGKKPYGIKLHKKKNLFNMGSDKEWILLSNSMDLSMVRNAFIYDLARDLDFSATPSFCYVDLYLNGFYNGLYLLTTKPGIGKNRLDITDLDRENKALNLDPPSASERTEKENEDSSYVSGVKLKNIPSDISGGYLIEHDYGYKFDSEPSRFKTPKGDKYVLKSPAYAPIEEVEYVEGIFGSLENKAESGEDLSDIIDLDSFIRIYVLDEFTRNEGAGVTSAYYYKDRDSVDKKLYAGPVWDYDQSMGNTFFSLVNETGSLNFCTDHVESTKLFYELYTNHPEFREGVMEYYKDTFKPEIEDCLESFLGACLNKVLSDNGMNGYRWGDDDEAVKASVQQIRDFIAERIEFLDRAWIDKEPLEIRHLTDGRRDLYTGFLKETGLPESYRNLKAV